jgi:cell division protein FtsW
MFNHAQFNFSFSRTNRTFLGRWLWTIDLWNMTIALILLGIGTFLVMTASPGVAIHHGWDPLFFTKRHIAFLIPAILLLGGISFLPPKQMKRLGLMLFALSAVGLILTLVCGVQIKGGRRWLGLRGLFVFQPSEFIKPAFALIVAWVLAEKQSLEARGLSSVYIVLGLLIATITPIFLQPDFGMSSLITASTFLQLFVAGLPMLWILIFGGLGISLVGGAYLILPHVRMRIDAFFNPDISETFGTQFQVRQSLKAFQNGGFWGRGPGEGTLKHVLPDSHADFIFAVAGEEFGIWFCILILTLFLIYIARSCWLAHREQDLFILYSVVGLLSLLSFQIFINTASTLGLIPPKGMTFPLMSYGGSSLLSTTIIFGLLTGLTRKRLP